MIEVVLDASVVLKWFRTEGEERVEEARALRNAFEAGELVVHAPDLLALEIVNVAGRRWNWDEARVVTLVESLGELGIAFSDPGLEHIARWTARGLTAYDAAYVALAEAEGISLVTDDSRIVALAPDFTMALAGAPQLVA